MFKKLKFKFIIINMSLLTFVFSLIFGAIYFFTWNSGNKQIEFTLDKMIHEPVSKHAEGAPNKDRIMMDGIIMDLDSNSNVVSIVSSYNFDKEVLIDTASNILSLKNSSDVIKIDDANFAYLKNLDTMGGRIVLVNKSSQENVLLTLLKIFFLTGVVSLLVLFLISYYLATKTIKPIVDVFEKQKQFIADASHELRTPIAIIKTNLALVSSNGDETVNSQSKWIDYINIQTDRMSLLINDMLSLAKLDQENLIIHFNPINMNKTLENLLMSFEAVFFENKITLKENYQGNFNINGNLEDIKKLFNILIDNSIKHTDKDGTITVELNRVKNKLEFTITNTGEGIPPESLDKIF